MSVENNTPATIYGQPGCGGCAGAQHHMRNKGVVFQYVDVTKSEAGYNWITEMGYKSVPVIVMGFDHTSGFDPDWINERLDKVARV